MGGVGQAGGDGARPTHSLMVVAVPGDVDQADIHVCAGQVRLQAQRRLKVGHRVLPPATHTRSLTERRHPPPPPETRLVERGGGVE